MNKFPKIPGYRIVSKIGQGGTASIYLGIHKESKRKVAVKILDPKLSDDKEYVHRFLREARLVSKLNHPNIVIIYETGKAGNLKYIIMECFDRSLKNILDDNPIIPGHEAIALVKKIAAALDYAHSNGIIHRDIKPANILFRKNGTPVIVDFGLARSVDSNTSLTQSGAIMGTPIYMSPEQCRGKNVDHQSDIYSLGVLLYEMLTGEVPYKSDSKQGVWMMHITEPIPLLPHYLKKYQPLIDRMLAKNKKDRFSSVKQVAEMIESLGLENTDENPDLISTEIIPRSPTELPMPINQRVRNVKGKTKKLVTILIILSIAILIAIVIIIFPMITKDDPGHKLAAGKKEIIYKTSPPIYGENKPKPGIRGGSISFSLPGGIYEQRAEIELSLKNLQSTTGDEIPSDVYYTINGPEPTRENAAKNNPGEKIFLNKPGEHTIKAKLFSTVGKYEGEKVYEQKYIIQQKPKSTQEKIKPGTDENKKKPIITKPEIKKPLTPSIETITNFMQLDVNIRNDIYESTRLIRFEVEGFESVKKYKKTHMQISISQYGKATMEKIYGIKVTPKDKEDEVKKALAEKIKSIKFLAPTSNGNPVNVKIWISFKKVAYLGNRIMLSR